MDQNLVIRVQNGSKKYGSHVILQNFNMHVAKGQIYGLLGASGCGKTTLINCLLGSKHLDSGRITVLDSSPQRNKISPLLIGYMPQEMALPMELTIKEGVYYFGKIFAIPEDELKKRFRNLSKLLDLPDNSRFIGHCSGGEQRRISFTIALINNPKLLILDEPTVGLDPILREVLWTHLTKIVKDYGVSVLITTHYIEEARQAHKVAFMRNGQLLAEDSPDKLLTIYEQNTLEEVFLQLSQQQSKNLANNNKNITNTDVDSTSQRTETKNTTKKNKKQALRELISSFNRISALLNKNFLQIARNISGTFFNFVFPIITVLALILAIGNDVQNIKIAIINDEHHLNNSICDDFKFNSTFCELQHLSCRFIKELDDPMINKIFYNNIYSALTDLKNGNVWGVLQIPQNFSLALKERIENGFHVSEEILNSSQIITWIDMSNKHIGNSIKLKLTEKILKLEDDVLRECNYPPWTTNLIQLKELFFGNKSEKFTTFLIPGVLLTTIYFMSMMNTVDTIISDRLGGVWGRSAVAGVSSFEIILTHFVTQFFIVALQVLALLILTFFIYKLEYEGNIFEILIILLNGGICGMTFGFFISVNCTNHSIANYLTTGSFYPLVTISGVIWPLEGMSKTLQYIALCFPIALPTLSLRNIIKKGWDLMDLEVLSGLGVQTMWIVAFSLICILRLKYSR